MSEERTKKYPKAELRVKVPRIPNFLEAGYDEKNMVALPVEQISRRTLRSIGKAWTDALVARSNIK